MADSDDEYDRKQRDKFRGERTMSDRFGAERRLGGGGGGSGRGDDYAERNPFRSGGGGGSSASGGGRGRSEYRDFRGGGGGGGGRDRYGSPSRDAPPAKRMRTDWNDEYRGGSRYPRYDPYMMHAAWSEHYAQYAHGGGHARDSLPNSGGDATMQPAMLTLKQFLETQDDNISDEEVLTKYNEYKLNFRRQQLNDFFVAHKDEEWFKQKYHPLISEERKTEQNGFLRRRTEVFTELLTEGYVAKVSVDVMKTEELVRLLDTAVIKLEGGTDEDLKVLDEKPVEPIHVEPKILDSDNNEIVSSLKRKREDEEANVAPVTVSPARINRAAADSNDENWGVDDEDDSPTKAASPAPAAKSPEPRGSRSPRRLSRRSRSRSSSSSDSDASEKEKKTKSKKRRAKNYKRRSSNSSSSSSSSDSKSSSSSSECEDNRRRVKKNYDHAEKSDTEERNSKATPQIEAEQPKSAANEGNDETATDNANITDAQSEKKSVAVDEEANNDVEMKSPKQEETKDSVTNGEKKPTEPEVETIDLDLIKPKLKALHQTSSIFLRNLAPAITKSEILDLCKGCKGLLRVAIADPLPERRWYRRGWITFEREVNVKDICWNLNSKRVRDCEIGAIVNRDLSRRVRQVAGLTAHKAVVRSDIRLCAKIIMNLDESSNLWVSIKQEGETQSNGDSSSLTCGLKSNNPVLQNIRDYLVEEASAEEEELLGISGDSKEPDSDNVFERDDELITVLDRLLLYLRIVHSVDYYNHCEYPYEDEMPNRCGIIHARGSPPAKLTSSEVADYNRAYETKLKQFLTKAAVLSDEEIKELGAKDADEEVKKFVDANTTKVAEGKWLCPLSEKKFKGPEFVHKHIFNKHMAKVEEVKQEVAYFNNYLRDPKRPQLQEQPVAPRRSLPSESSVGGYRPPMYPPAYLPPAYALPPMPVPGGRAGGRGFGGRGREPIQQPGLEHQRRLVAYHDLDSPANFDMFE